ncbi:zinc finger BED domain-containing protein 3-like [Symphalangus syndactylus]|uniref:zinc finger BED domain-containing protein 3-like n=1 Tax=Symphalangus syndactylus TaxID=9590 RepID=UPI003006665D
MVPAAQRLPHQPGDAEGAEARGVSPPGVGSSSETGDKCPAPPSAARGLHHLLAQSRGAGRECGRRGREKGWGGGGEAEARSWSPSGCHLPPPRGPAPPPGASSAALGGVPAGAARPAAAPQARARRAAAEAVCNRQLLQPREESRDRREEPGRRGRRGGRGEKERRGAGRAPTRRRPGPRRTAEREAGRERARRRRRRRREALCCLPTPPPAPPLGFGAGHPPAQHLPPVSAGVPRPRLSLTVGPLPLASRSPEAWGAPRPPPRPRNPSVLRRWNELMCTLGIGMTSSPNERSRLSGKRSRRETRAEQCVAARVEEEKRSQWSHFPASLAKRESRAGGGEREELMII